ncbi:MAG TPA: hypothetical protein VD978_05035 [Azospirillum sp.]|nr:hypothetical protein [Azospirillum sp.]
MSTPLTKPMWRCRVIELLDDPVGLAILRRDGLTRDDVLNVMAAAATHVNRQAAKRAAV